MAKDFVPKIVAFCCNWSAYPAVSNTQRSEGQFLAHVKFIKIMCGGMVTPALILKAFELGSDGVLIVTCHVDDCHYITGAQRAADVFEETVKLIEMLGFEPDRLRLGWYSADQPEVFVKAVHDFINVIQKMGPSPMKVRRKTVAEKSVSS